MSTERTRPVSRWLVVLVDVLVVILVLLLAVEVIATAALLVDPHSWLRDHYMVTSILEVPDGARSADGLVHIEGEAAIPSVNLWARVRLLPASRRFVLLTSAASLLWWACYLIVLLQLRRVCSTASAGRPFPWENVRRIRLMGWAVVGTAVVDLLIDAVALAYLTTRVTVAGEPARVPASLLLYEFPFGTILAGLAVFVLAEIFKTGADLEDDQALTI